MRVVHSWLQDFLSKKLNPAQVAEALSAAGIEVEKITLGQQPVIDVTTPANRPDLNSLIGLAREVAAHSKCQLKQGPKDDLKSVRPRSFEVSAVKLVGRYGLAELKLESKIKASPVWMRKRLELSGVRPINAVVDVTNYCMLAYGQSFHAFDKDKIAGKFIIRLAKT